MPPKARVDEDSFQQVLPLLELNELHQLESSSTTDPIWGYLCSLMKKGNNPENRRACYDIYKRKRVKLQPILNQLVEKHALQTIIQHPNSSPQALSTDETIVEIKNPSMPDVETKQDAYDGNIICHGPTTLADTTNTTDSSTNTTGKGNNTFVQQLLELISRQEKTISIVEIHDHNASLCTGTIKSIQIICECFGSCNHREDETELSVNTALSKEDHHVKNINQEKKQTSPLIELDTLEAQESANEIIEFNDECSTTSQSLQLRLSPASSVSIDAWPRPSHDEKEEPIPEKSIGNSISHVLSQMKNIISPKKSNDHSVLDNEQRKTLELLQRRDTDGPFFMFDINEVQRVENANPTIVSQTDMNILKNDREKEFEKKILRKKLGKRNKDDVNNQKETRNLQWTIIFDTYIKHSNPHCVFMYSGHHFTEAKRIPKSDDFFMSFDAFCKFRTCTCAYHAILQHDGRLKVNYTGTIVHEKDVVHARPIRDERRQQIQQFTNLGVTPKSLYLQQLSKISSEEKAAGNRNSVGSSPAVIRKISSEGNVKLRRDDDLQTSLQNLKNELANKIFPAEPISGYLQEISLDPLRLICFTAGGIAAYHNFCKTMPLSWDATGSIVINRERKIFYYELTMSNVKRGGPSLPVTIMLTESHTTMDIVHWMNCFIEKYKQVYGYALQFPRPPVIHSDRATAFLLAGIQIFNHDETMARYLERCWRIVKRVGTTLDIELTVVHACLGHFMKNVKKNASKVLTKKQVPFGMWLMALLVNSNILEEMSVVWQHICIVLLSPTQNNHFKISISTLSKMANEMNQNPDKTNFVLQHVSVSSKGEFNTTLTEEDEDNDEFGFDMILGQEEAVLSTTSSFKELFSNICQESKSLIKEYDTPTWNKLPVNPLFSAGFVQKLLKLYMPFAPIWSNLLLGNFLQRYGYSTTKSISNQCSCHYGRTTGVSEAQMRVLKEAVLKHKVYSRVDQVISKISENIEAIEIQFADHALNPTVKMRLLPAKKQKPAVEPWNKRKKTKRTTGVYTSEKPAVDLITMMHKRLLEQKDDENLDAGQLQQFLRFENQHNNCWFNALFQMLLASGDIVDIFRKSDGVDVDLMSMTVITITSMLTNLIKRQDKANTNNQRNIISNGYIMEHINYLAAAGLKLRSGAQNCLFDFFDLAIVPNLLYHEIEHQIIMGAKLRCSSCKQESVEDRQYWQYLLVPQISSDDSLERTIVDLFHSTLQKKMFPQCFYNDEQHNSLSVISCPRNLFLRFDPQLTTGNKRTRLMHHIDLATIVSKQIINTASYAQYTLQSFIVFYGSDAKGHFATYAQKQGEWYRLDDMNISLVQSSTVFGDANDPQPVLLAHYTRPLNDDIFSIALWNVLTDFNSLDRTLPPTLSLNDAVTLFAKTNVIQDNPLNFIVIKYLACSRCKAENFIVDHFSDVFDMKHDVKHVKSAMLQFFYKEVQCLSCKYSGLTRALLYDMPEYLVLNSKTEDMTCVQLINDIDLLTIESSMEIPMFEYSADTIVIALERNDMFYLRKKQDGFVYYNKTSKRFEHLKDISTHHINSSTSWVIFIYKTNVELFSLPELKKKHLEQKFFSEAIQPDLWSIETVQTLLPTFQEPFDIGNIIMKKKNLNVLLDNNGDLNDLVIDAYLSKLSMFPPSSATILAVPAHRVSQIIEKRLKHFDTTWLHHDIILCPINQKHHWYLIIIDRQKEMIIEIDSMNNLKLPRRDNIQRLLQILDLQQKFEDKTSIDFTGRWTYTTPLKDQQIQQDDAHSCGVHLLLHAEAYVTEKNFPRITRSNVRAFRHQLAENILRKAMSIDIDCNKSHEEIMSETETQIRRIREEKKKQSGV